MCLFKERKSLPFKLMFESGMAFPKIEAGEVQMMV